MSHRNETDGEGRNALLHPALPTPPPHQREPIPLGLAVRAVVIRAGKARLHLKVFGPVGREGWDDRAER